MVTWIINRQLNSLERRLGESVDYLRHIARTSTAAITDLFNACTLLQQAGIEPLDFSGNATSEPAVLCWMPAAAVYFRDPDGHLLEYLAMLPDAPRPDLGILDWASWQQRIGSDAEAGVVPARSGGLL